jgi:excisionase family DNA binding protein
MDDWITTSEAARLSGYHPEHVRRLIVAGKVKARKFGIVWQVSRRALLAYVRASEKAGEKRGPKSSP